MGDNNSFYYLCTKYKYTDMDKVSAFMNILGLALLLIILVVKGLSFTIQIALLVISGFLILYAGFRTIVKILKKNK